MLVLLHCTTWQLPWSVLILMYFAALFVVYWTVLLLFIKFYFIAINYNCTALCCNTLIVLHSTALHCTTLHYFFIIVLNWIVSIVLYCTKMHYTKNKLCFALFVMYCTTLHHVATLRSVLTWPCPPPTPTWAPLTSRGERGGQDRKETWKIYQNISTYRGFSGVYNFFLKPSPVNTTY